MYLIKYTNLVKTTLKSYNDKIDQLYIPSDEDFLLGEKPSYKEVEKIVDDILGGKHPFIKLVNDNIKRNITYILTKYEDINHFYNLNKIFEDIINILNPEYSIRAVNKEDIFPTKNKHNTDFFRSYLVMLYIYKDTDNNKYFDDTNFLQIKNSLIQTLINKGKHYEIFYFKFNSSFIFMRTKLFKWYSCRCSYKII